MEHSVPLFFVVHQGAFESLVCSNLSLGAFPVVHNSQSKVPALGLPHWVHRKVPWRDEFHLKPLLETELFIRQERQGVLGFEGSMVGREKARFYGVSEVWGDLGSSGARGFRAGVAHKLAHWTSLKERP